jgi:heme-degrading monooxygenase HmoA
MRLAILSIATGLMVGLVAAVAGESMFGGAEIGSQSAQIGAMLLVGSPAIAIGTTLLAALLGWVLGRSGKRSAPRRPKSRTGPDLPRLDGAPHQLIAMYRFRPGTIDRVARQAETELAAVLRKRPGFVGYEFVKTGENEGVSVSTWASREQAEAAVDTSVAWATVKAARAVRSMENHVGAVVISDREAAHSA